ncbi:type II secretion system F family protein [Paenarthrobacter sp.]|uniref:type II secretion system F family protein n=1 Tax=Paenarthrobacter sp. TaxID=1931993 RepID=UPI0028122B04|nr:type II secretion system F family protein [Paenarthrobacter sp.]
MNAAWSSPFVLIGGLLLLYVTLVLLVMVVFKSRRTIDIQRRQQQSPARQTALTVLTESTKGFIDSRLTVRRHGLLSQASLDAAGLKKHASDYVVIAGVVALIAGVTGVALGGLMFGVLVCIIAVLGLYATLRLLTARRRARFDEQVPDTLQMLTGGMRAGHSLLRAIDAGSKESEAPMSEELGRIVNETRIGRDMGESLSEVGARTASEDFQWIAQAIEIHREVGGDLAEVLDHVGETIRDRNQIRRQVRALSAEGRISALVLVALPVIMFTVLCFMNPLYAETFTSTLPGYFMIAAAVVLLSLGSFWLSIVIKPKF